MWPGRCPTVKSEAAKLTVELRGGKATELDQGGGFEKRKTGGRSRGRTHLHSVETQWIGVVAEGRNGSLGSSTKEKGK